MEEKDLQLYIRAAQLARGEDVDRLLQTEYELLQKRAEEGEGSARDLGFGVGIGEGGAGGSHDNNAAFYENYLKTIEV